MFVEQGYTRTEVKTLPYTLEGFIAWLETKDPDERYDWMCVDGCAVGQFRAALGISSKHIKREKPIICLDEAFASVGEYWHVAFGPPTAENPSVNWTFGKCLERARQALRERK